jgi:hypothetical protein
VAKASPQQLGRPFTTWSLSKLVEHLGTHHRIVISTETVRVILRDAGIRWQATKTWKGSRDPDFTPKMARILDLYDNPPADGRVICVDEFGPLNLMPRPGRGWFRKGQPARQRATYTRTAGVRHMFGALDLASGQVFYRFRDRKRWQEFLGFLRQLRSRFSTGRLYVVCDNFSPHKKREVADWCADHDVELVFTPSNASWLNWIESEFTALRYFTLDGSDYPSHRPRAGDRRLHPVGQPPRQAQAALRRRLQDPQTRLPTQRCLTRHQAQNPRHRRRRTPRRALHRRANRGRARVRSRPRIPSSARAAAGADRRERSRGERVPTGRRARSAPVLSRSRVIAGSLGCRP